MAKDPIDPYTTPPPTRRHLLASSMKVSNQFFVQDESGGRPRPMLRTIPLPVHGPRQRYSISRLTV